MSSKHLIIIIALSATLISCGEGAGPEINSTNCSGGGMQSILPTFKTEAERQAFIDKCQSLAPK